MCKDFLRMGFSNFIVDPGVRLGYTHAVARQVYNASRVGIALFNTVSAHNRAQRNDAGA